MRFEGEEETLSHEKNEVRSNLKIWNKEVFGHVSIRKEIPFNEMSF